MKMKEAFIHFAIAGGSPPATGLSLTISADNVAIVTARNAWPVKEKYNEAGIYKVSLAQEEIDRLKQHTQSFFKLSDRYGERSPGSLNYSLTIHQDGQAKKISWNHFAKLPDNLKELRDELLENLDSVRQFPYETIQLNVELERNDSSARALMHLTNSGKNAVKIIMPEDSVLKERMFLLANMDQTEDSLMNFPILFSKGKPFPLVDERKELVINPESTITFENNLSFVEGKQWYGIAELQLDITNGTHENFYCSIIAEGEEK